MIILFILWIIIYYNKYLIAKKEKPFNVPKIFSETLFPDINENEHYTRRFDENSPSYKFLGKYYNI